MDSAAVYVKLAVNQKEFRLATNQLTFDGADSEGTRLPTQLWSLKHNITYVISSELTF